jgi:hypothetical protein
MNTCDDAPLDRECRRRAPPPGCRRWRRASDRRPNSASTGTPDGEHDHEPQRHRHAEQPLLREQEFGRQVVDPAPPVTEIRPPRRIDSMPERHHDRRDPGIGDKHADQRIDAPCRPAPAPPTRPRSDSRPQPRAGDRRQHADQRADRDVDIAGDDDHRHADGGDRDVGIAGKDGVQIVGAEEARIDAVTMMNSTTMAPPQ